MIIKFSNLGAIKQTELDLRPLTVIIGPNNSNKTYIAYSVYGLWRETRLVSSEYINALSNLFKVEEDAIRLPINSKLIDLTVATLSKCFDQFTPRLSTYFQDSSKKVFQNTQIGVEGLSNDINASIRTSIERLFSLSEHQYHAKLENDVLSLNRPLKEDAPSSGRVAPYLDLHESMTTYWLLWNASRLRPFILPAERNAFILTYKLLQYKRFQILRGQSRELFSEPSKEMERQAELLREQGDIRFPEPIEDFLDALNEIEMNGKINQEEEPAFQEIANLIEKYLQGSQRTQFRPTRLSGKELVVKVNKGLVIDLYNASSSIKQLAPLLLYLRYRAQVNDLLIIDEPEMNLHPESQVKLLEILAMLVNAGVKVLLTTHSPYFLSHLNNLAQTEEKPESVRKRQATSLYLKDPRAFLSMEQVSAYEMKNNELVSLKDPDYGIRWDTFGDVAVDVSSKYFEIYEKGKGSGRARKAKETAQTKAE